jgi:hypothetical protein
MCVPYQDCYMISRGLLSLEVANCDLKALTSLGEMKHENSGRTFPNRRRLAALEVTNCDFKFEVWQWNLNVPAGLQAAPA